MPFNPQIPLHKLGFAPDLDPSTPGILLDGDQCYPTTAGIRLLPGLQFLYGGIPPNAPVVGAINTVIPNGSGFIYAGTREGQIPHPPTQFPSHLYILQGGAFVRNDSQVFSALAQSWRFGAFNADVIAVNGYDPPQVSANGGIFAPLGGNPPSGSLIAVVDPGGTGTFVFLMNTANSLAGGGDPTFWCCSKQGVDNVWSFNIADNSTTGFLQSTPGPITACVALGTSMIAFKPSSIYVGQFTGPPFIWSFQPYDNQYGVPNQEAVVNLGDVLVFANFKNPCFFTFDGVSVRPILNACSQWFLDNANQNFPIRTRYDANFGVVFFHFNSTNNHTFQPDLWLAWNITNNRWTVGHLTVECCLDTLQESITQPALFIPNQGLMAYTGPPTPGYLLTGYNGQEERLTRVSRARAVWSVPPTAKPKPGGTQASLQPMISDILGAPSTAMPSVQISPRSWFDFIRAARYHQFKLTLNVDSEVTGFYFENSDAGTR